jgi:hypothetical protein
MRLNPYKTAIYGGWCCHFNVGVAAENLSSKGYCPLFRLFYEYLRAQKGALERATQAASQTRFPWTTYAFHAGSKVR